MEHLDVDLLDDAGDRFKIQKLIGEGTYGEVYRALDTQNLDKAVAVKIFDSLHDTMPEIEEEYSILSNHWIHPNLPTFHGVYLKKGMTRREDQIWLVMQLCEGGSVTDLAQNLKLAGSATNGSWDDHLHEEEIAYILNEVAHALVYLHSQHILHRDIKGNNILLTGEGDVKLIDYGISCKVESTMDKRHTSVGTPYWMAPEVIACEQPHIRHSYDNRCDVWSLGITAIELADGKVPLGDIHPMRALFQIPRNPPPRLRDESMWSETFVDFVGECLIKDYEGRPTSFEIIEHPFLQNVAANPTHIKMSLCRRFRQLLMDESVQHGCQVNPYLPTVRGGLLREKRKGRLAPIPKDDLAALETIDEESVLETIKERYFEGAIYTYLGDILAAINPYCDLGLDSPREMLRYRNMSKLDNPPHIFAMANHAYHAMMHERKNQRILVSGESGAGKTVSANMAVRMLVYLGRAPHRNIEDKILQVNPILECFGNARTRWNNNSSRFAKYIDLSFSKVGKITGARILVYLLESSRVVASTSMEGSVVPGHFNFHVFYAVLQGLRAIGRLGDFHLPEDLPTQGYRYLSGGGPLPAGEAEDSQEIRHHHCLDYKNLVTALKLIGFREAELDKVFGVIAAILLLGEITFVSKVCPASNMEGSEVDRGGPSWKILEDVCQLLGIEDVDRMHDALVTSNVTMRGEVIRRVSPVGETMASRDAMAKGLYTRLFDYLVTTINKLLSFSMSVYGESTTVGILDIFGFENHLRGLPGVEEEPENSLEQLCINTANEQLQYYFDQFLFCWEREEYLVEGIPFAALEDPSLGSSADNLPGEEWHHRSNRPILDLLLARPIGLFAILDEESRFPSASDTTLMSKMQKHLVSPAFSVDSLNCPMSFVVHHYADKVEYSASRFLEKNRNFLAPDLIAVLRTSSKDVVGQLFCSTVSRSGQLVFMATYAAAESPGGCPATQTNHHHHHSQSRSQQTLATNFRYSLVELLRITLDGAPHFVRCFKPNSDQKPNRWHEELVVRQLRYSGLLQIVVSRRDGFSHRLTFAEFLKRYCFLGFNFDERVVATRECCQLLLLRLNLDGYALGKTKVFLKYYHIEYLSKMYERNIRKIIRVQAAVRRWLANLQAQKEKWEVARHLFLFRIFFTRWKIRAKLKAALNNHQPIVARPENIGPVVDRPEEPSNQNCGRDEAAREIQRYIRGFLVRKHIRPLLMERLEKVLASQNVTKINQVKEELKQEGLTEDEAARLIQTVYRKIRRVKGFRRLASRQNMSVDSVGQPPSGYAPPVKKSWAEAEKDCMQLMQAVHLNNVEAHRTFKRNKDSVEMSFIKQIHCDDTMGPRPSGSGSERVDMAEAAAAPGPQRTPARGPVVVHFYNDHGPREEWDSLLVRHAKQLSKSRALGKGGGGKMVSSMASLNTIQSVLSENDYKGRMQQLSGAVRRRSSGSGRPNMLGTSSEDQGGQGEIVGSALSLCASRRHSGQSSTRGSIPTTSPGRQSPWNDPVQQPTTPSPRHSDNRMLLSPAGSPGSKFQAKRAVMVVPSSPKANYVDHLKTLKRNANHRPDDYEDDLNENHPSAHRGIDQDEDQTGPFDFRSILRKSNFAPTESLRKRRGLTIPVLQKSSDFVVISPRSPTSDKVISKDPAIPISFIGEAIDL